MCGFIGFALGIMRRADAAGETQAEASWLFVSLLLVGVVISRACLPFNMTRP